MSGRSFYVFLAVLAAITMTILSTVIVGQVQEISDLRAELVATRAVLDSAAVLTRDNNGWMVASRDGGYRSLNSESTYETATRVRVVFSNGKPMKQFLIFRNGTVVMSELQPNVHFPSRAAGYAAEEQIGDAIVANWGDVAKWR
ncbi:MAG: hypothetical protein WCF77_03065 [Minisyncoccia bacterium]|jgi:hypothetical protein